jgi:RNA recognition motif-containing protein
LDGRDIIVQSDQRDGTKDPPGRRSVEGESGSTSGGVSSVFVGNLPFEMTWKDLRDLFQRFGRIDHADITKGPDGKSKGHGIIQFVHVEDAKEAMKKMDGKDYKGRSLQVKPNKKVSESSAKVKSTPPAHQGGKQLFVGNLSYDVTWKQLKELFQKKCTGVEHADVMEGPNGRKKGYGTVQFATEGDASRALSKMNGFTFEGRKLEVRYDKKGKVDKEITASTVETKGGGTRLFVGNLSFEASSDDLLKYFRKCGKVEDAQVIESQNGFKKGFAIVNYANSKDAERAIEQFDGKEFMGRDLQVRWDKRPDFQPSAEADTKPSAKPVTVKKEDKPEEPYDKTLAVDSALKASR